MKGSSQFRMHEDAAHDVGDQHASAIAGIKQPGALAGCAGGIVGRTQELIVPRAEGNRLLLVPDVVAGGHHIGTGIDRLEIDVFGNAEAASGILAIDDDKIELSGRR